MKERGIRKTLEEVKFYAEFALLLPFGAFTKRQREAIVKRDKEKCQFPGPHVCNESKGLEVHHIIPQRYSERVGIDDPDYPENGISLCKNSHQKIIHPDIDKAHDDYRRGDKDAYKKCFKQREKLLDDKIIYWNSEHDRRLSVVAVRNTQKAKKEGWIFPPYMGNKKK